MNYLPGQPQNYQDQYNIVTQYGYDNLGNRIAITDTLGRVTRSEYDRANRVSAQVDAAGQRTSYGYDPLGNRLLVTDPLGRTTQSEYDAVNRAITTTRPLNNVTVTRYDALGNRVRTVDPRGNATGYGYDAVNRNTRITDTLNHVTTVAYDAVGRRTQNASGTVMTYTYDIANRLTNVNGQSYTWDDNGNLLNDGVQTYTYDQANRLKTAVQGGATFTFTYNGVGDRLSQTIGITTTRYVLDLGAGLTQVLSDGSNAYLYGNGRLAQYQASMQYFGADGLGSVRQIFDASAIVVGSTRYDPYGNVMAQSGTATSVFAFAGEQQDATGLEYLRARYYSSAQGRFTTRDVWAGDPNAPMSYNAWLYAYADAVNLTDPSGRVPIGRSDQFWCGYGTLLEECAKLRESAFPFLSVPCEALVSIIDSMLRALQGSTPTPQPTETQPPTKVARFVTLTPAPTQTATATPTPTLEWLDGDFTITHYSFALESDPLYANDERVSANGLPPTDMYREGFLFGARGTLMQGTGLAENGQYITIDWMRGGPQGRQTYFRYGVGGHYSNPVAWETVATGDNRLPRGTQIRIGIYPDRLFTVADTGGDIGQGRIDVFVGAITIAEADQLGRRTSRVAIVR